MFEGYIKIPRSLLRNPLWIDLPPAYKEVFLVILEHVVYGAKQEFDDHGKIITLLPGQICITIRGLQDLCGKYISKNEIERAIKKLFLYQFVRQEVRHVKTILTITHKDTYDMILKEGETTIETRLRQDRDKIETQIKKEEINKKEIKDKHIAQSASPLRKKDPLFFNFQTSKFEGITQEDINSWLIAYPGLDLSKEIIKSEQWLLANPSKSKKSLWRKYLTGWLARNSEQAMNKEAYASIKKPSRAVLNGQHQEEYDKIW